MVPCDPSCGWGPMKDVIGSRGVTRVRLQPGMEAGTALRPRPLRLSQLISSAAEADR